MFKQDVFGLFNVEEFDISKVILNGNFSVKTLTEFNEFAAYNGDQTKNLANNLKQLNGILNPNIHELTLTKIITKFGGLTMYKLNPNSSLICVGKILASSPPFGFNKMSKADQKLVDYKSYILITDVNFINYYMSLAIKVKQLINAEKKSIHTKTSDIMGFSIKPNKYIKENFNHLYEFCINQFTVDIDEKEDDDEEDEYKDEQFELCKKALRFKQGLILTIKTGKTKLEPSDQMIFDIKTNIYKSSRPSQNIAGICLHLNTVSAI
jgi:hypothetical protein